MEKEAPRYVGLVMGEVCKVVCSMCSSQRATRTFVGFKVTGFLFLCAREREDTENWSIRSIRENI